MIVLIVVTNCYIVDFQYALFVLNHQDCLFLSYCGIFMHINSLQHIVVLHSCPNTTTSPSLYGACIILLGSAWCITGPGFFSISLWSFYFVQLPQSVNCTLVITITYGKLHEKNLKYLRYFFPCVSLLALLYLIEELTILVPLKIVFLLIFCANLLLVLCVLFFRVAMFLIR